MFYMHIRSRTLQILCPRKAEEGGGGRGGEKRDRVRAREREREKEEGRESAREVVGVGKGGRSGGGS
jgi:hypothetical protein